MSDIEKIKKIIDQQGRPYFFDPFSDGINTYAANIFCVVRIKDWHSYLIPDQYKIAQEHAIKMFDKFNFSKDRCTLVLKKTEVEKIIKELSQVCPCCKGSGFQPKRLPPGLWQLPCEECDGEGRIIKGNLRISKNTALGFPLLSYCIFDAFDEIKVAVDSENIRDGVPFIHNNIEGIIMPVEKTITKNPIRTFDYQTNKIIDPW